jgi:cAMP phosphodiesterase
MKIKVLGCYGGQLPGYHLTGFLLDGKIMLDAGTIGGKLPIQEQRKIRAVLLTHAHLDHIGGLPLFGVNITSNKAKAVTVAAADVVLNAVQKHVMNWEIWPDFSKIKNFGGQPVFKYLKIPKNKWVNIEGYKIRILPVKHTVPTFGFIIGKGGRFAVYTGDTKQTDALWKEAVKLGKKLKSVIIEAAYPNGLIALAETSGHLVPRTVELELRKLGKIKPKVYIDHMKPEYAVRIEKELRKIKGYDITMMDEGKTYNL